MKLEIKPIIDKNAIARHIKVFKERIDQVILLNLNRIGEQFIIEARTKTKASGGFGDRTGNLRSSIGYIILKDGKQFGGGQFEKILDGTEGANVGNQLLQKLKADNPKGWVFIGCAGMNYAIYVEAKGFDVISGSTNIAENSLKAAVDRINKKVLK